MAKANANQKPNDINAFLGDEDHTNGSNSVADIKSKLMSVVSSMQVMDEEKENIKEILADLKATHEISPAVARAVAKILHKPESLEEMNDKQNAIEALYEQINA